MGAARRDAVWVFTFCFSWVGFWGVCVFGLRVFGRRGSSEHRFVTGANLLGLRFGSAGGGGVAYSVSIWLLRSLLGSIVCSGRTVGA